MKTPSETPPEHLIKKLQEAGMVCPDYAGQGLFNLAVSLARLCGADLSSDAPELRLPDGRAASQVWEGARRVAQPIVFLLIDGLGDAYLEANRRLAPNLWRDRIAALTSVFPSTTATAITTLMTARVAAEHGQLGWFVRDEVSERVVASLPMRYRGGETVSDAGLIGRLLPLSSAYSLAKRRVSHVTLPELVKGAYSGVYGRSGSTFTYRQLAQLPDAVLCAANSDQAADGDPGPFVYAYISLLDSVGHDNGIESEVSRVVLAEIDRVYAQLKALLPQALIIASADHGFIDNPPERCIDLASHPDLYAMLRAPLSGERRVAYCHVKSESVEAFGPACMAVLGHALIAVRSADVWAAGLFGANASSHEIRARTGDWILLGRDDWTVMDRVPGERPFSMPGVHGGLSAGEMRVPLIVGA